MQNLKKTEVTIPIILLCLFCALILSGIGMFASGVFKTEPDSHYLMAALDRETTAIRVEAGIEIGIDEFLERYPKCCTVKRVGTTSIFSHAVEVHILYNLPKLSAPGENDIEVLYLMNSRGDNAERFVSRTT